MGVVFIELCSYITSFVFRNILRKVENLERIKLFVRSRLRILQLTLLLELNIVLRTYVAYPRLMKTYLMINTCHI